MLQWIANLFRRRRTPTEIEESFPCIFSEAESNVRVDVLEVPLPCGHTGNLIRGEFFVEEYGEWLRIIELRDYNAKTALWLLRKAVTFLSALDAGIIDLDGKIMGPRELPTLVLWGRRFYIDERLKELRNVEDPNDRVELRAA